MRIYCANCGKMHDSTVSPFMYDKISDRPVNVDGEKEVNSSFVCKHCKTTNFVRLTWYASHASPETQETDKIREQSNLK